MNSTSTPDLEAGNLGRRRSSTHLCFSLLVSATLLLFTAACASPGGPGEASHETVRETTSPSRGQRLFESRCIACHGFYAPNRYSDEEWDEIIPDMAHEALLTRAQTKAVLEYVKSAN